MGRSTGIVPIAIQARAPATTAVMERETRAQRPSVVAKAALALPTPRRMLVMKRAEDSRRPEIKTGSVCNWAGLKFPNFRPPSFQYLVSAPIPVPGLAPYNRQCPALVNPGYTI